MTHLINILSEKAGNNTSVELTCDDNASKERFETFIQDRANDRNRQKYEWSPFSSNHCRTFADEAFNVSIGE